MARLDCDVNKVSELGVLKSSDMEYNEKMGVLVKKNYSSANIAHLAIFNKENGFKNLKNNMNKTTYQSYIPNYNKGNFNLNSTNIENSFNDFESSPMNGFRREMYGIVRDFNGYNSRNKQESQLIKEFREGKDSEKKVETVVLKEVKDSNGKENEGENEHVCLVGKQLEEFRTKQCPLYARGSCINSSRCSMSHSETWPRRNPILFKYDYKLCPNIQFSRHDNKMQLHGKCSFGRRCRFSHSKEEQLYHPDLYKTRYCLNFPNCKGYYCPFAHSKEELRSFNPSGCNNSTNNNINSSNTSSITYNSNVISNNIGDNNNNRNNLMTKEMNKINYNSSNTFISKDNNNNNFKKDLERDLNMFKGGNFSKNEREEDFSNTASTYSSYNDNDIDEMSSTYNELSSPTKPFLNNLKYNINENFVDIDLTINNNDTPKLEDVEEDNWFESLIKTGLNLLDQDNVNEQDNIMEQEKWQEVFSSLSNCSTGKNCPLCSAQTVEFKFETPTDHMVKKSEEIFKTWGQIP